MKINNINGEEMQQTNEYLVTFLMIGHYLDLKLFIHNIFRLKSTLFIAMLSYLDARLHNQILFHYNKTINR